MRARIHLQARSSTQSGESGTSDWVLDFAQTDQRRSDPLMGWTSSGDTQAQVTLRFSTREAAVAYADAQALDYEVEIPPPVRVLKPKAYADNFRYGRRENWSH